MSLKPLKVLNKGLLIKFFKKHNIQKGEAGMTFPFFIAMRKREHKYYAAFSISLT